ncbi:CRP/FNR family transcriptional regulator, anaerobic regulatory protein [Flavobacterium gillisiae]|uniref:CRP/FNR family transcriptional regulator, anaerobic regulatory protein n=1 Tax=Flavobacterium gillisiae TaxID=150146 RepID=A0A1H3XCI5_9FLAO|nr:Crp/Fnr family transcriptional regulator [Flavobacterium gillisiae]SDZ97043.1 CRP/FNR family transcriptional regulator, anaerobic regulatory protein [Flavobacterium gillisiae]
MTIDVNFLFPWAAFATKHKKNEVVFHKEEAAHFYYQIIDGGVKIYNSNIKGEKCTQGLFCAREGLGESPLFVDETYPCKGVTIKDSTILKLSKKDFLKIIEDYPPIRKYFLLLLSKKIHSKSKN